MLITERLRLRLWAEADKVPLAAIHADPIVMNPLGGVRTAAQTSDFVDRLIVLSQAGQPVFWAAERISDGKLLGCIGLHRIGREFAFGPGLEVGWRLGRDYWGKGYATEGALAALDYAFDSLNEPRVVAFTTVSNARSEAVMKRLGMNKVEDGEFMHPDLPEDHPLAPHLLYAADAPRAKS